MSSRTIVVGLDAHDGWEQTVDWAADEAAREGGAITLVHVTSVAEELWHDPAGRDQRPGPHPLTTAELLLDRARARVAARRPGVPVQAVLRRGGVRDELHATARDARLLVVGSRRHRTVWSRLFGTTGSSLTRRPPCPAVVVHQMHPGEVRRGVLVGVDGTEHSLPALRFAFRQASSTHRPLTVVHVAPALGGDRTGRSDHRRMLAEAVAGFREEFPDVPVTSTVEDGDPVPVILRAGRAMHLIVLGAHHHRPASELLLGSVVAPIVERATCPVAVVPAAEPTTAGTRRTS